MYICRRISEQGNCANLDQVAKRLEIEQGQVHDQRRYWPLSVPAERRGGEVPEEYPSVVQVVGTTSRCIDDAMTTWKLL